ncbi:MAG: hypothetical protein V3T23_12625, partial [Nitrososphaerales archaeon]
IHHAGKLGQQVVSWGVHYSASIALDEGCHQLPVIGQGADGRLLIFSHQMTVTFDIRTKNGSEFAFHTRYSNGLILRDQYHRGKGCQGRQDEIKRRFNGALGHRQRKRRPGVDRRW